MSRFDKVFEEHYGKPKQKVLEVTPIKPANLIVEKVIPKLSPVHLITPQNPYEDETVITVESLLELGFIKANPDEFVGAGKDTYFLEVENVNGRTTLVYDFQPHGNHGRPALHLYFNSNEKPICETLVCFAVEKYTVGSLTHIIESSQSLCPVESKAIHNIKTVQDFITEVVNDSKEIIN